MPALAAGARVLLVSMPFAPLYAPSLGLSLLQGQLQFDGVAAGIRYFGMDFAKNLGEELYCLVAEGFPSTIALSGEWLFSHCLFPGKPDDFHEYVNDVVAKECRLDPRASTLKSIVEGLLKARSMASGFVELAVQEIADSGCQIVGFTSVFQQHVASLATARRLKEIKPEVRVVFGGANCEGEMGRENLRKFDFIDVVVSGEGELAFAQIVGDYLRENKSTAIQPNVYRREVAGGLVAIGANASVTRRIEMDDLPFPDYSEYIDQAARAAIRMDQIRLLFESSRGCWWGQKHHCTFCGLNGSEMQFRSKSAGRCLEELEWLSKKFKITRFSATDNILDPKYFETFLPALAAAQLPVQLFYEVKANLKKRELRLLRDAGVTSLQPGIESLNSTVLQQMRKGITGLQNIQTLKWCKEFGIEVAWNILWGFPREPAEAYDDMVRIIPLCEHLPAPLGVRRIRMDRFSPNFEDSGRFGFSNVRAAAAYRYVYPFDQGSLDQLAYYFDTEATGNEGVAQAVERLGIQVDRWIAAQEGSDLIAVEKDKSLVIIDLRSWASAPMRVFQGPEREVLLFCDEIHARDVVVKTVMEKIPGTSFSMVADALEDLVRAGLLVSEGNYVLSLAILDREYSPGEALLERLLELESNAQ
jgi:ribosomal peptide maturation radical SAM protein 1